MKYFRFFSTLLIVLILFVASFTLSGCTGYGGGGSVRYVHSGFGVGYGWDGGRYMVDRPIIIGPGEPGLPIEPPLPELPEMPEFEAVPFDLE